MLGSFIAIQTGCGAGPNGSSASPGGAQTASKPGSLSGVLGWKGDQSGSGNYAGEKTLTPAGISPSTFGQKAYFRGDSNVVAQPLYLSGVDLGGGNKKDLVIFATEHNSVYAFDANGDGSAPVWEKHYTGGGVNPAADNYGGRTTLGGEIGITGTPVVDAETGWLYFVTMVNNNGVLEQWLRAIDIKTGNDVGPGSVKITAQVAGDGRGSNNGQIAFDPTLQNQRAGLILVGNQLVITWGSFSDWGVYHGWIMAYDKASLQQTTAMNTSPQAQPQDDAFGPADHGGGAAIWMGGAAPSVDSAGNIYLVAADGSFNANSGGQNYGDSVLKLKLDGAGFHVVSTFTPFNQSCLNPADLEIGSGGVAIVPGNLGVTVDKSGNLYLLDLGNLGGYNAQQNVIPATVQVGNNTCASASSGAAEGPGWQRLYGNPAYWNGFVYVGPSNTTIKQYTLSGNAIGTSPKSQSGAVSGMRGANMVVSSDGNNNGIVWAAVKNGTTGQQELHALDALDISHELWATSMGPGYSFATPVVANGKVLIANSKGVSVFGMLQ